MKTVWVASLALVASTSVFAQSQIYKHVDENGRITYTNRPMKGAVAMGPAWRSAPPYRAT
jgi:hypothetical protein